MNSNAFRALTLAGALVGWSFLGPRVRMPWRVVAQSGLAGLLVLVTRAPLGLAGPRLWAGLRIGAAAALPAATGVATTTAVPVVRLSMADRELPRPTPVWLMLRIPVGTVWAEEAAYRGALGATARTAFGETRGRLLQAAAFGLSHIADARATGEPVLPTVVATGIAGWVFGWLAERSGSLAAPMLAHLAINEAGAAAALAVQAHGRAS
ncbi:Rv0804 family intramembrane glutamic endopeptidase [Mycobacterium branderi]|uniref:Abortive phage infection protein n=1 Tax=Mycobacterium branderi TaxID=43348 RepID=A0AA91RIS1_9MYCO|nr:CPBP family intramembrane glutamic endopeptidase [Mycobacterium branderi]MCV7234037.1 CPBP family intramembrane metalloprotease [Mycobacterium branderi]ORA39445.1 abortive phage infection protein [Mycobacterium branderi]